ncbi:MAG: NfeD family protein [Pseudomonadales bacterium]|nr:NfeD family protein [Pseudomonadales bacterium]
MESFQILYWHWVLFGLLLIGLEMVLPTFLTLWFGLGALLVGAVLFIWPEMSLAWQLGIWLVDSAIMVFVWFKFIQPQMKDRTKAGMGREALLGETGIVITVPREEKKGRLRFPTPILGDDEWEIICQEEIAEGDRVIVIELSGNALVVSKK